MEQEAGDWRVLMSSRPKLFYKDTGSSQSALKHSGVELRCGRFGSRPCHPLEQDLGWMTWRIVSMAVESPLRHIHRRGLLRSTSNSAQGWC